MAVTVMELSAPFLLLLLLSGVGADASESCNLRSALEACRAERGEFDYTCEIYTNTEQGSTETGCDQLRAENARLRAQLDPYIERDNAANMKSCWQYNRTIGCPAPLQSIRNPKEKSCGPDGCIDDEWVKEECCEHAYCDTFNPANCDAGRLNNQEIRYRLNQNASTINCGADCSNPEGHSADAWQMRKIQETCCGAFCDQVFTAGWECPNGLPRVGNPSATPTSGQLAGYNDMMWRDLPRGFYPDDDTGDCLARRCCVGMPDASQREQEDSNCYGSAGNK